MTNFEGHLRIGVTIATICAIGAFYVGFSLISVMIFFLGIIITSLLPDIDIHSSKPRRYFGILLVVGCMAGAAWIGTSHRIMAELIGGMIVSTIGIGKEAASGAGLLMLIFAGAVVAVACGSLLDNMTVHRGRTHTLSFGIMFGVLLAGVLWWYGVGENLILLAGLAPVIGVGSHVYVGDR